MADPALIILMAACSRGLVRWADALAQWVVLRARIELIRIAVAAPPSIEFTEQDRQGRVWWFRSQQPWEESRG